MPPALALPPQKVRHRTKAPSPSTAPAPSSSPSTATATAASSPPISNTQSSPPPMSPTAASKLPRFLQSPAQRDRSKSLSVDRPPSVASNNTSTSSSSGRRRLLGIGSGGKDKERERERQRIREAEQRGLSAQELLTLHEAGSPDSYVCGEDDGDADRRVGPSSYGGTARPRTRSERHFSASTPPSSASDYGHGNGNGNSTNTNTLQLQRSPSRLDGPLATRLSGWFAHLAGSTSDLSLANTISGAVGHSVSTAHSLSKSRESKEKDAGGSKTSLLDKAVRYLLDGDAAPDRAAADIWLLARVLAASVSSNHNNSFSHAHSHHHSKNAHPEAGLEAAPWPAAFHARFYALVWCTYRAGFEPIRDLPSLSALPPPLVVPSALAPPSPSAASHNHNNTKHGHGHSPTQSDSSYSSAYSNSSVSSTSSHGTRSSGGGSTASAGGTKKKWWPLGGTKGWTSDAGWGCMLRTGQSLLACALSRVGELDTLPAPHFPPPTARAHALHARLLSWFLDAPVAPFGVHRMALAGKALGKDVGMWFGPSAAAGAISRPFAGLLLIGDTSSSIHISCTLSPYRRSFSSLPLSLLASSQFPRALALHRAQDLSPPLLRPLRPHAPSESLHLHLHFPVIFLLAFPFAPSRIHPAPAHPTFPSPSVHHCPSRPPSIPPFPRASPSGPASSAHLSFSPLGLRSHLSPLLSVHSLLARTSPPVLHLPFSLFLRLLPAPAFCVLVLAPAPRPFLTPPTLVDAFPAAGLGVSVATDGTLYQTEVFAASHSPAATAGLASASSPSVGGHSSGGHGKSTNAKPGKRWGDRPVLLLLGIRLGLDGVNPVYYETIKVRLVFLVLVVASLVLPASRFTLSHSFVPLPFARLRRLPCFLIHVSPLPPVLYLRIRVTDDHPQLLYTFPQSVGIAGGRPSSSYYFVGVQGDGLFYLDPHHSRPAVPMRPAPSDTFAAGSFAAGSPAPSPMSSRAGSMSPEFMHVNMHANARARSMSPDANAPMTEDELTLNTSTGLDSNTGGMGRSEEAHYARAYTTAELRTFHCERVRKMPLSGLDPSMLIGFVCRDEAEWVDLRRRVAELPRTIFSIQDEPPTWPGADDDDDEMGLESISDPEDHDAENDVEADGEGADRFFDDGDVSSASHAVSSVSHGHSNSTHSTSAHSHAPSSPTHYHSNSNSTTSSSRSHTRSEDVDTEEDPVGPITPLPGARFDLSGGPPPAHGKAAPPFADADADVDADAEGFVDAERDLEIEDDWVDPVAPSPPPPVKKSSSGSKKGKGKAKAKGSKKAAVPVPSVHYPFPVSVEDSPQQERQQGERERNVTVSTRTATAGGAGAQGQRMHTARARDGGRTQSGGVRGVLTDD
ncbi:hypothetical protein B0H10DRAFT_2448185 [Mycena sp. CBHHK59/15]|nr:hypothetical protein B0H10DRAFT_2448185 [Mycena sp. CBHHK59/15]